MALSGNCTEKGCQQFISHLLLQMERKAKISFYSYISNAHFLFSAKHFLFSAQRSCRNGPNESLVYNYSGQWRKFHTPNDNQTPVSPYRAVRIFNAFNMPTVATTVLRERVKKD